MHDGPEQVIWETGMTSAEIEMEKREKKTAPKFTLTVPCAPDNRPWYARFLPERDNS